LLSPDEERSSSDLDLRSTRLSSELLEQSFAKTVLVYLGMAVGPLGGGIALSKLFGLHPAPSLLFLFGAVYFLAGIGWPRALYLTLRSIGQFARVNDPQALRQRMRTIGVALMLGGLFILYFWFNPEAWPWTV
jgi:hypothetical protein